MDSTAGTSRLISVSASAGSEPGLVDSAPRSSMSAPSSIMVSTLFRHSEVEPALLLEKKESSVRFTMAMSLVLSPSWSTLFPGRVRRRLLFLFPAMASSISFRT